MHQLLLHGSVPSKRHHQVLSVLAGLTAIPTPPRILERHYIYRPAQSAGLSHGSAAGGASQQVDGGKLARRGVQSSDVAFVRLVEELNADAVPITDSEDADAMNGIEDSNGASQHYDEEDSVTWTMHLDELPEPGLKIHVSRRTQDRVFNDKDDVETYIAQQHLTLLTSYLLLGHYLVYNHVLLRLYRCMRLIPDDPAAKQRLGMPLADFERRPLDGSGAYVLEASVQVEDDTDTEVMARGSEELQRIKEELIGCVELRTVERLSLDSRLR